MPDVVLTDSLVFTELMTVTVTDQKYMYGSPQEAVSYFSERVDGQLWLMSNADITTNCLITATRAIDCLRFLGSKTDPDQYLEWPRNTLTTIPDPIKEACFEEAYSLLRKRNPDTEYGNLFVTSRVFDKVRTNYDYARAPEHIVAGITSYRAWLLLRPYLAPNRTLLFRRGS